MENFKVYEENLKGKDFTGYPHIDKPWMKFYNGINVLSDDPKMNLTSYLKEKTKDFGNKIAQTYYGKETTFNEYFYDVDNASKVLTQLGVKKGDNLMNLVPNIPESSKIWQGATQIGAISDFIDPRPDSMDIQANAKKVLELVKYERANYIVALDKCYLWMLKPIENELKDIGIEKIIVLGADDSMNLSGKISYLKDAINYNKLKNMKIDDSSIRKLKAYQVVAEKLKSMKDENKLFAEAVKSSPLEILKYSDLVDECKNSFFEIVDDPELINYIGHTSGTSGSRPKPITSTNKNGISTLEQLIRGNVNFGVGESALHVLPFFAPFGTYDNFLLNMVSGSNSISVPEFEINEYGYLLKKYHPNVIMGTPAWLVALMDCSYLQNMDLSFLTKVIYGGDTMSSEDEEKLNLWFKNHGSSAEVEKGHGMSEFMGCGSYAQKKYNKPASIGIPLPNTIYGLVDPDVEDKLVPVKFKGDEDKIIGELVVSSDAVTDGILHGDVIVPHFELDGKSYIRTRDLVEMDREGVFFHQARKDRSFSRFDGFKVKPHEIEKEICKNDEVKYALVVEYFDDKKRGLMPMCHIVLENNNILKEEYDEIVRDIVYNQIIANHDMSSRQIPTKFRIRENLPLTKNSKVDINSVKKEGLDGTEINVDISETNLSVDKIEIYANKKEEKTRVRK